MTKFEIAVLSFFTALVAMFGLYSAMAALPPASYWFAVDRLEVHSGFVGEPVVIDYEREINQEFEAAWRVSVWQLDPSSGQWVSYCVTPETTQTYRTGAALPSPVTLDWFAYTSERCYDLPAGTYYISGEWAINPNSRFSRRVSIDSEPFILTGNR